MLEAQIFEENPLRGLTELCLVVEVINPEAEVDGLKRNELMAMMTAKLRKIGIRVVPNESADLICVPYFYLNVNPIRTDVGLYVCAVRVALKQRVILPRQPLVSTCAATWEAGGVGTVGANNLNRIVTNIGVLIDRFCRDYCAANRGHNMHSATPLTAHGLVDLIV